MADEVIAASSEEPSAEDERLRALVTELISQQNAAVVDLGKTMLTVTFTAIGVVLAVHERGSDGLLGAGPHRALLIAALVALFLSVPVYLTVVRGYRVAVSAADYQLVEEELSRLATLRNRLLSAGMTLTGAAALLLAVAIV